MYTKFLTLATTSLASVSWAQTTTSIIPEPSGDPSGPLYFISFGDSYSQTGFEITGEKPSAENPIGNPELPGWTAAGGFNWVGLSVTETNADNLLSFNFAYGGATTDADLVEPYEPEVVSFADQVDIFSEHLGTSPRPEYAEWTAENTLVGVWIGVNDVGNTFWLEDVEDVIGNVIERYFELLQVVYDAGARQFVLLNVPPTDKTPLMMENTAESIEQLVSTIELYNGLLETRLAQFEEENSGITAWFADTIAPFNEAIEDPTGHGAPDATCISPDGQSCLWVDEYHPGLSINQLVAEEVARVVGGPFFQA